nr:MAG TPA: hypothetical protein [Caudoviricetes sp.]
MDRNLALYAGKLLTEVFGVNPPIFIPWGKTRDYVAGNYEESEEVESPAFPEGFQGIELVDEPEAERLSWMGTPVVGVFNFQAGQYNCFRQGQIGKVNMPEFLFPYATLVTFSRAMNMTQTKIIGSAGTVKEIYGLDDWGINIQGICLTDRSRPNCPTADEQVAELIRWRNVTDTINVSGPLFTAKDIYALCIKSFSISPQQGRPGAIPFTIEAVSDEPIELVL